MILDIYKPVGKTNGEIIDEIKKQNPNIKKICFAGRLDPLACGLLKVLTDDDIYKQDSFCNLDKIYSTWLILNWTTDSYDILGIPQYKELINPDLIKTKINELINIDIKQKYPPYSSMTIKKYNKPYWQVSKEGLSLEETDIPTKNIKIYDIQIDEIKTIQSNELFDIIEERINLINRYLKIDNS
jgi:tRNA U55 pseudouridine synthase TruB